MALEHRNGKTYHYTTQRVGSKVIREYGRSGYAAVLCQQFEDSQQELRRLARFRILHDRDILRDDNAELRQCWANGNAIISEAMHTHGWHAPQREWRKQRNPSMNAPSTIEPMPWNQHELFQRIQATDPELFKKKTEGKLADEQSINRFLDNPAAWELWGNIGREVLAQWAGMLSGKNRFNEEALLRYADDLRNRLAGSNADGLVMLLAERVVMAWVFATWSDATYYANLNGLHAAHHELHLKRIEMANRNLLAAAKPLAKVKRMKLPDVMAIVHQRTVIEG